MILFSGFYIPCFCRFHVNTGPNAFFIKAGKICYISHELPSPFIRDRDFFTFYFLLLPVSFSSDSSRSFFSR